MNELLGDFRDIVQRSVGAGAPSSASSLRPLDATPKDGSCGASLRVVLFSAILVLGTGTGAVVSCGSVIVSSGASLPACALTGWGTWFYLTQAHDVSKEAMEACER